MTLSATPEESAQTADAERDALDAQPSADVSEEPTRSRSSLLRLAKVLAVIAAASAVLFFVQRNTDSEVRPSALAPDFEFVTYDGELIRLSDLRGQGVVLNFWASWCGPCQVEAPLLVDAWEQERDNGIAFIGLTHQDTEQGALQFMEQLGMDYPNGPDSGRTWARRYDVNGIPATFFIDEDGILMGEHRGMIVSPDQLKEQLDKIRPGR
jgi:cytochrome c biogenesis protein CcmG/thiol:disulfide interchange protein DsbE